MLAKARAMLSLDGLSVGDAFGEQFAGLPHAVLPRIARRELAKGVWPYTDDTQMALSVVRVLVDHDRVEQDVLAELFAARLQPGRGYGTGAYRILAGIRRGGHWRSLSRAEFGGGSLGNGAAMRIAPLGAFFADHPIEFIAQQARLSSEVTHAHPEGIAGGIAVAVAAALALRARGSTAPLGPSFLLAVSDAIPPGETRDGVIEAARLPDGASPWEAARTLGNGSKVTAPDTVPFCLWACSRFSESFVEAMWSTVSVLGDCDTNCAIVGGVVACKAGRSAIPEEWLDCREAFEI